MTRVAGIVFDFDGLILDTETPEFESWSKVYRDFGVELHLDEWIKCVGAGPGAWDVLDHLESLVGRPIDRETVAKEWIRERDRVANTLLPLPGFLNLVAELEQGEIPFAIASSSVRAWVVGHLERLNLAGRFPLVFTRDNHAPKPAPDLYLAAIAALEIDPTKSFALEDSLNGVMAAKAAALNVIAVPNAITRHQDFHLANRIVSSLEEVSLARLGSWLAQSPTPSETSHPKQV